LIISFYGGGADMNVLRSAVITGAAMLLVASEAGPAFARASSADDVPPVVSATGLSEGQVVGRTQQVTPTWSDDVGVVKVEVLIDGTVTRTYQPTPANGKVQVAPPKSSNGTDVEVMVRAYDAAGNSGTATTRVHVDLDPPTAVFTPPLQSFVGGVVTITAAELPADVARITLWDESTAQEVASATSAPWTLTWDTTGLPTGGRWVQLAVYDHVQNLQLYRGFYAVDNTMPQIRIEFPAVPGRINKVSTLNSLIVDSSPTDRVEWWIDGTLQGTGDTFTWDTKGENRTATLEVRAYDTAGNSASSTSTVVLDNTGPAITAIAPGHRALVRGGTFRTTVYANDGSGIRDAYLNGAYSVSKAPYTVTASAGPDGMRTLTWYVIDRLGNTSKMSRTVVVDNTRPTLKITKAPKNGAKVRGTVKLAASAADRNGIARVELLVNGKVIAKDVKAGYTFSINTRKYGKKIKFQLRAYDRAGNVTYTTKRTYHR
jgi:hypothetical protein